MSDDIVLNASQYPGAMRYAKLHNISFRQLVESCLAKFQLPTAKKEDATLQLPPHLEKLGGCLTGLSDPNDEKLNCLLGKYK